MNISFAERGAGEADEGPEGAAVGACGGAVCGGGGPCRQPEQATGEAAGGSTELHHPTGWCQSGQYHLTGCHPAVSDRLAYTVTSDGLAYTVTSDGLAYTVTSDRLTYTVSSDRLAYSVSCDRLQAWELRMEKSAEKWGPSAAPSGGSEGNAPGEGQGVKPTEAEAF